MVWVPGTDYPPAQQHVGYPVFVLPDGSDTGATQLPVNEAVMLEQYRRIAAEVMPHFKR